MQSVQLPESVSVRFSRRSIARLIYLEEEKSPDDLCTGAPAFIIQPLLQLSTLDKENERKKERKENLLEQLESRDKIEWKNMYRFILPLYFVYFCPRKTRTDCTFTERSKQQKKKKKTQHIVYVSNLNNDLLNVAARTCYYFRMYSYQHNYDLVNNFENKNNYNRWIVIDYR